MPERHPWQMISILILLTTWTIWTGELEKDVKEDVQESSQAAPQPTAPAASGAAGAAPAPSSGQIDINYLLDVNLLVTVEVGRRQYFISDVLSWDHGSVVPLDKMVGEPINLLVNNKPVAKGEVVVINDKFALKIVEILDPSERIQLLNN